MADKPINLKKFRKAKARAEKEHQAAENRVKFGRSKVEKFLDKKSQDTSSKVFDGHLRETDIDKEG